MNTRSSDPEGANPGSTDDGLVEGIRAHDEDAWTRFVEEYSPAIYVWCRSSDLQPADALDVSQQVFQAVSRSISTFSQTNRGGSLRGWLFVITKNLIRNYLTRTLRGPRARGGTSIQIRLLEEPESVDEDSLSGVTAASRGSTIQSILEAARASLDDRTWQCFWRVPKTICCWKIGDPRPLWKRDLPKGFSNRRLLVSAGDWVLYHVKSGPAIVFSQTDGEELWRKENVTQAEVKGPYVVICDDGGAEVWRHNEMASDSE